MRWELGPGGEPLAVRFDAASLELICQMEEGNERPGAFSASDRERILLNLRESVLEAARFPQIVFAFSAIEASGEGLTVRGELTLHGRTQPLELSSRREGGRQVAEVTLHQPDFGIRPFSAMLGALRVRPDVRVRFEVGARAAPPRGDRR